MEYDFDELSEGLLVNFTAPLGFGFSLLGNFMLLVHWEDGTVQGLYFSERVEEDLYDADGERLLYSVQGENRADISRGSVPEPVFDNEMEVNKELTLEEKILEIVDVIPVSTSYIAEELLKRGESLSVPALMTVLMDMTCCGKIAQNGAYYRRIA